VAEPETPFRLSVGIPLFREEAGVPELVSRLGAVLDRVDGGPHEIVCVDDGSDDGTVRALQQAAEDEPRLVIVSLTRNFGHQAALSAALDHSTGDAIVLMDGDLQDPPEAIPDLLKEFERGYDVVYARRVRRKEGLALRFSYWLFYRLAAALSDLRMPLDAGDFSLISRRAADAMRSLDERQRYLRGVRSWVGFRQIGIDVERAARATGESKYGVWRLVGLALDGLFSFTVIPLRIAMVIGVAAVGLTSSYGLYALWVRLVDGRSPEGFTAILGTLVLVFGVNLFFLGVIGEYIGRIYREVKSRPRYLVEQVWASAGDDGPSGG